MGRSYPCQDKRTERLGLVVGGGGRGGVSSGGIHALSWRWLTGLMKVGHGVGGVERVRSRATASCHHWRERRGESGVERAFAQVQYEMPVRQASGDVEWTSALWVWRFRGSVKEVESAGCIFKYNTSFFFFSKRSRPVMHNIGIAQVHTWRCAPTTWPPSLTLEPYYNTSNLFIPSALPPSPRFTHSVTGSPYIFDSQFSKNCAPPSTTPQDNLPGVKRGK